MNSVFGWVVKIAISFLTLCIIFNVIAFFITYPFQFDKKDLGIVLLLGFFVFGIVVSFLADKFEFFNKPVNFTKRNKKR